MIRRWKRWQAAASAAIHRWGCQMHEPLFLLACGAIAGILLADHWSQFPWWAMAGVTALAGVCLRKRWWSFLAVTVGFALLHGVTMQDPLRKEAQRVIAPGGALQARVIGGLTDAAVKSA